MTAYRLGEQLTSHSFVGWLGEEKYKELVNFCLRYLSEIECPVKRGTFIEFRYYFSLYLAGSVYNWEGKARPKRET